MSDDEYPPWQEYSIMALKQGWIIDSTDPEYRGCKNMWSSCGSSGNGYQGCFNFVDQNCKPKFIPALPMTTTTTIITPAATEIAVTTKSGSTSTTNAIDTFFKLTSSVQTSTTSIFKLKTLESTKLISQTPSTTVFPPPYEEYSIIAPKQGWIIDSKDPKYAPCKDLWFSCSGIDINYLKCFNKVNKNCKVDVTTVQPTTKASTMAVTSDYYSTSNTNELDKFFKLTSTVQHSISTSDLKTTKARELIQQNPSTTLSNEAKETTGSQISKVLSEEPPFSEMVTKGATTTDTKMSSSYTTKSQTYSSISTPKNLLTERVTPSPASLLTFVASSENQKYSTLTIQDGDASTANVPFTSENHELSSTTNYKSTEPVKQDLPTTAQILSLPSSSIVTTEEITKLLSSTNAKTTLEKLGSTKNEITLMSPSSTSSDSFTSVPSTPLKVLSTKKDLTIITESQSNSPDSTLTNFPDTKITTISENSNDYKTKLSSTNLPITTQSTSSSSSLSSEEKSPFSTGSTDISEKVTSPLSTMNPTILMDEKTKNSMASLNSVATTEVLKFSSVEQTQIADNNKATSFVQTTTTLASPKPISITATSTSMGIGELVSSASTASSNALMDTTTTSMAVTIDEKKKSTSSSLFPKTQKDAFETSLTTQTTKILPNDAPTSLESSLTTLKLNDIATSVIPAEATQFANMAYTDSSSDATMKSSIEQSTVKSPDVTMFDTLENKIQSTQKLFSVTSENNLVSETTSQLVTDDNSKTTHGTTGASDNLATKINDFTSAFLTFPFSKKYSSTNSATEFSTVSTSTAIVAKETASELLDENKAITTPTKTESDFSMATSQSNIFDSSTSQLATETSHDLETSQNLISLPSIDTPSTEVSQLMDDEFSSEVTTSGANKNDMNLESTFDTPTTESNVFSSNGLIPSFTTTKLDNSQVTSSWTPTSSISASESVAIDNPSQTFDGKASATMATTTQTNLKNYGSTDNPLTKFYTLERSSTIDLGSPSTISQSIIQTLPEQASTATFLSSSPGSTLVTDYSTLAEENSKEATTVLLNADNVKTTVNNFQPSTVTLEAAREYSPINAALSTKDGDQTTQLHGGTTKKEALEATTKKLTKPIITSLNPVDTSSYVKITESVHTSSRRQSFLPYEAIVTSSEPIIKFTTRKLDASSPGVKNDVVKDATNFESQESIYSTQSLLTSQSSKSIESITQSFDSGVASSVTFSRILKNTGTESAPVEKSTSESPDTETSKIEIIFGTILNPLSQSSTLKSANPSQKSEEIKTFSQQQTTVASSVTDIQVYDFTTTASDKITIEPVTASPSPVISSGLQTVDQIATRSSKDATLKEVTNSNIPSSLSGIKHSQSFDFSMMPTSSLSESQSAASHVQSEATDIITQKSTNDLFSQTSTKLGTSKNFVDSDKASSQILTTIHNTAAPHITSTVSPAMSPTLNTDTPNTNSFVDKTQETDVDNTEEATTIFSKSVSFSSEITLAQNSMTTKKPVTTAKPFITLSDIKLMETETQRTSVDEERDSPSTIISTMAPTSLSPSSASSEKLVTVSNTKAKEIKTEIFKTTTTQATISPSNALTSPSTKESKITTVNFTMMNSKISSPLSSTNLNTKFVTATKTQTTSDEDKIATQNTIKDLSFEPTSLSKPSTKILDPTLETFTTSVTTSQQLNTISDIQSAASETEAALDNVKTGTQKAATYASSEANTPSISTFTASDSSSLTSASSITVSSASTSTSITSSDSVIPAENELCEKPCPVGFSEGSQACYKWMEALTSNGFNYTDFEEECFKLGNGSVIVSLNDFEFAKNIELFNELRMNSKNNNNIILTNTVWTKEFMISHKLQAIDLNNLGVENKSIIEYYDSEPSLKFSSICRIGKYCKPYNCDLNQYMASPSAKYFGVADNTQIVVPTGTTLTIFCNASTTIKPVKIQCNRKGFFVPDSSLTKCSKIQAQVNTTTEISEPQKATTLTPQIIKSCIECSEHSYSCNELNGNATCICENTYTGSDCSQMIDPCANTGCLNEGKVVNKLNSCSCYCTSDFYGEFCENQLYDSDYAAMYQYPDKGITLSQIIGYLLLIYIPSAPGSFADSIPIEACRNLIGAAMVFVNFCKLTFPTPTSAIPLHMFQCQLYFSGAAVFFFMALSIMMIESFISYNIITASWSNLFIGQRTNRNNSISSFKFHFWIIILTAIPAYIICTNASSMISYRSCLGTVNFGDSEYSLNNGALLYALLIGIYTGFACFFGILARLNLNRPQYAMRRREYTMRTSPYAFGRELYTVEFSVKWLLPVLRPLFFALSWLGSIYSNESLTLNATIICTLLSGIHGIVSFIQGQIATAEDMDGLIENLITFPPQCLKQFCRIFAPRYNPITLQTRDEIIRICCAEQWKIEKEEREAQHKGSIVQFPREFEQFIERDGPHNIPQFDICALGYVVSEFNYDLILMKRIIPFELQKHLKAKWTLEYLKGRSAGLKRWEAVRNVFLGLIKTRLAAPQIPHQKFRSLFKHWMMEIAHYDRLGKADAAVREICRRGVAMLTLEMPQHIAAIKPSNLGSDWLLSPCSRADPLLTKEKQQEVYDFIDAVCKSITFADIIQDENQASQNNNNPEANVAYQNRDLEANFTGVNQINNNNNGAYFANLNQAANRSNDPWVNVAYNQEFQHNIFDILREGYNPDAIFNPEYFELNDELAADANDVVQPFSLRYFLLDETRPNFIGPRTYANIIPPGVTILQYTAFYWRNIGDALWTINENRAMIEMVKINYNTQLRHLILPELRPKTIRQYDYENDED